LLFLFEDFSKDLEEKTKKEKNNTSKNKNSQRRKRGAVQNSSTNGSTFILCSLFALLAVPTVAEESASCGFMDTNISGRGGGGGGGGGASDETENDGPPRRRPRAAASEGCILGKINELGEDGGASDFKKNMADFCGVSFKGAFEGWAQELKEKFGLVRGSGSGS